jgi:hypothetical protein
MTDCIVEMTAKMTACVHALLGRMLYNGFGEELLALSLLEILAVTAFLLYGGCFFVCGGYKVCKNWLLFELSSPKTELFLHQQKSGGIRIWALFLYVFANFPENQSSD